MRGAIVELKRKHGTVLLTKSDYELLKNEGWSIGVQKNKLRNNYLRATISKGNSRNGTLVIITIARHLLKARKDTLVDHIDNNSLNNVRSNLRLTSHSGNSQNKRKTRGICTSKYKGVCYEHGKWRARINAKNNHLSLGFYDSEIEAAGAYNHMAKKIYGEYYNPNTINGAEIPAVEHKPRIKSSKHVGISYAKNISKWHTYVTKKGKRKTLGYFKTERVALLFLNNYKRMAHEQKR